MPADGIAHPHLFIPNRSMEYGGSRIRPEATGYGAVYFAEFILADKGESLEVGN